jgi:branched-chain amino acid transport system substrate-binding protein
VQQRSIVRLGVPLAVAALALSACGSRDAGTTSTAGSGTKTVKIGVIAPLSGGLSALGLGIKNSVDLAIKQANETNAVPGWKFELAAQDDEAKAEVGKNAATKLSSDDAVLGVVGTLNSSVAQQTMPVLARSQDRPGVAREHQPDADPGRRRGCQEAPLHQLLPHLHHRRGPGSVRGPVPPRRGHQEASRRSTTRRPTARAWSTPSRLSSRRAAARSSRPRPSVRTTRTSPRSSPRSSRTPRPRSTTAASTRRPGRSRKQMKSQGLSVPLMGGDGIYDPKYVELAGATANGDLSTSVGAPTESTEAGRKFLDQYKAAGFAEPAAAYGGYAYDAAKAIIEAAKTALKDAKDVKSARAAELTALGKVSFDGVTGKVAFDEFGDTTSKILTVYKVDGGKWIASKTDTFK